MKKPSFFSRLTGSADSYVYEDTDTHASQKSPHGDQSPVVDTARWNTDGTEELAIDIYQTPEAIVLKTFIAGINPSSLDIALTREMVTIRGTRHDENEVEDEHYFQRELCWGSCSRTVLLPEDVDVDMAEASERHGILHIRLPKINKKRETKLKVRSK